MIPAATHQKGSFPFPHVHPPPHEPEAVLAQLLDVDRLPLRVERPPDEIPLALLDVNVRVDVSLQHWLSRIRPRTLRRSGGRQADFDAAGAVIEPVPPFPVMEVRRPQAVISHPRGPPGEDIPPMLPVNQVPRP